jgi:hypothetical protein
MLNCSFRIANSESLDIQYEFHIISFSNVNVRLHYVKINFKIENSFTHVKA